MAPALVFALGAAGCATEAQAPSPRAEFSRDAYPAADTAAGGDIGRIDAAIHRYAADRAGRLPSSLAALVADKSPEGDRYLPTVPSDPWGRAYSYAVLSSRLGTYDLRSYGPDRLPGTPDDVVAVADPVPVH